MGAPYKKTRWKPGLVFALPLADGSFGIAQAIAPLASWAVDVALFSERFATLPTTVPALDRASIVSVQATWNRALNGGWWAKIGEAPLVIAPGESINQKLAHAGRIDVDCVHASHDEMQNFLSAYHGLIPWNLCPQTDFDHKLLHGVARPKSARVLDGAALWLFRQAEEQRNNVL